MTNYDLGKMRGEALAMDFPEQPSGKLFLSLMNYDRSDLSKSQEYREGIKDGINEVKKASSNS